MEGPCLIPPLNFTGSSRYAGAEIDVGLRYSILPGLFWTPRFGWAFLGDAWKSLNVSSGCLVFCLRLIYVF